MDNGTPQEHQESSSTSFDEIKVMSNVSNLLAKLEDERAVARVIRWLADKHGVKLSPVAERPNESSVRSNGYETPEDDTDVDVAEYFFAANPKTDADKALVISAWMHLYNGAADIESHEVNKELKQIGYGIGNITRAFDSLMTATPRLAYQVRKSGKSKQARKRYRITEEGFKRAREMQDRGGVSE